MKTISTLVVLIMASPLMLTPAHAGPYADALSKCLVESTSQRDRTELVRWFFASASLHPAVCARPKTVNIMAEESQCTRTG